MPSPTKGPAAVVLAVHKGRVLALTRGDDFSDWHLPGGKQELGERLAETASRELEEETGFRCPPEDMIELCSFTSRTGRPITAFTLGFAVPPPRMNATAARHSSSNEHHGCIARDTSKAKEVLVAVLARAAEGS